MRNFGLLCLLFVACQGFCSGLSDTALANTIKYGVAWESYWNAAYNDLTPDASARTISMLAAQGKSVQVAVWKAGVNAGGADSAYYIEPVSPGSNEMQFPHLMIYAQGSTVTAIDLGMRGTNASLEKKAFRVGLSRDFRKEATQFSPGALKMLTNLQVGLKGLFGTRQHQG